MGARGYGIFQSDADLDVCDEISSEAANLAKIPKLELFCPKNQAAVVKKLNTGLLGQLFIDFEAVKWDHGVIYLGALVMQLGARITLAQIAMMHQTLKRTPMYDKANAQVQKGLNEYKNNGEPYDFKSPGVYETMGMAFQNDKGNSSELVLLCSPNVRLGEVMNRGLMGSLEDQRRVFGINVFEDWSKMPRPKPKPVSKENQRPKKEGKQAQEPSRKDGLGDKGTLSSWLDSMGESASI